MPACASASRTPAWSSAAAAAASTSASGSTTISSSSAARRSRPTRFRSRSSAWCRARSPSRCGCAAISHVLSCGCTSSTDAIGYAAALLRSGEADVHRVGRRRRVRDARDDLRVLAHEGGIDGVQRAAGGGVAAVRQGPRRLRARRRRVDGGAGARGPRAGARREGLRRRSTAMRRPAMPITACRWRPTAKRSSAPWRWRSTRSGARPEAIGYVSYHGTSTVLNDAVESRCVRQVFGDHADRLAGSSVKSMIGHPQGASGAAGIVTAALAHVSADSCRRRSISATRTRRAISTSYRMKDAGPQSTRRSATAWGSGRRIQLRGDRKGSLTEKFKISNQCCPN